MINFGFVTRKVLFGLNINTVHIRIILNKHSLLKTIMFFKQITQSNNEVLLCIEAFCKPLVTFFTRTKTKT